MGPLHQVWFILIYLLPSYAPSFTIGVLVVHEIGALTAGIISFVAATAAAEIESANHSSANTTAAAAGLASSQVSERQAMVGKLKHLSRSQRVSSVIGSVIILPFLVDSTARLYSTYFYPCWMTYLLYINFKRVNMLRIK